VGDELYNGKDLTGSGRNIYIYIYIYGIVYHGLCLEEMRETRKREMILSVSQ